MLMDPNALPTPPLAPPPNGTNPTPYDFIVNSGQQAKKPGLFGGAGTAKNNPMIRRLAIVAGAGIVLIIAALVFVSILGNAGKDNVQALLDIAEQQQEIIRVTGLGLAQAQVSTPDTQNLAITTQLSLLSNQHAMLGLLNGDGQKLAAKDLVLKKNASTDAQLTTAAQNGTFDATFVQILDSELSNYGSALQTAYKSSKSSSEKQVLQASYNNVTLLLSDPAVKNQ